MKYRADDEYQNFSSPSLITKTPRRKQISQLQPPQKQSLINHYFHLSPSSSELISTPALQLLRRISRLPDACNSNSVILIYILMGLPVNPPYWASSSNSPRPIAHCVTHPRSYRHWGPKAKGSKVKGEDDSGQDSLVSFRLQPKTPPLLKRLTCAFFSILRVIVPGLLSTKAYHCMESRTHTVIGSDRR